MNQLLSSGIKIVSQEPMSKHTTLGIGGPAEWYAEAQDLPQLSSLLQFAREKNAPVFYLGAGSNLLVSDSGIAGLIIRLRGTFETIEFKGATVRAGAGVFLPTLVKRCAQEGFSGPEPLVGVPGTMGGALVMNAGTHELWIGAITESAEVLDGNGKLETISAEKIKFQYRSSSLAGQAVCYGTLRLTPGNKDAIQKTINGYLSRRLATQPIGTLNVGSIFKNPEGGFAAQLIERAGLKGLKKGNAQVSPKHANFIVNNGGAKASEIVGLVEEIQKIVREKFGVSLEPEIKILGK